MTLAAEQPASPETSPERVARRTLARPHTARLLVDGMGPDGTACHGVELADRRGTPLLACERGSALETAGREGRPATLTVVGPVHADAGEGVTGPTVLLRGRLAPAGTERLDDREVALVEIVLDVVRVAGGQGRPPADVDLTAYLGSSGPDLAEYADLVLDHTNSAHEGDLIGFVADLCGSDPGRIAGARLSALDAAGIDVRWVDADGAHEVRVLFPHRASCCEQLAGLLQQTLCSHC